jgi:hypothetical protein
MKASTVFALTIVLALGVARAETSEVPAAAKNSTLSWLSLTDGGQYEKSWNAAASLFQAAISSTDWAQSLTAARSPLGQLKSRDTLSATFSRTLPGAPDGEYVVFQFSTSFENKASAVETVTAMKDSDQTWRVAGYYIK